MNNTIDRTIDSSETYPKGRLTSALAIEAAAIADGTRPFKCKYCRSTFRYKQSFDLHIEEVHNKVLEWSALQALRAEQTNQMINTNQLTNIDPERVAISQYKAAKQNSVIIQNPNVFY